MITLLIASLVIFIPAWLIASWLFPKEGLKASLLYLTLVLFEVTIIELGLGIIGQLNSLAFLITSLALSLIFLGIMIVVSRRGKFTLFNSNSHLNEENSTIQRLNKLGIVIISSLIVITTIPFYSLFFDLLKQILLVHPLSWDVVSYHLPNVMDYINSGSLWTLQGEYNQYPGGNELIQIWSFLPLRLDTLLGINTAILSLGFLLVSTLILGEILPNQSPFVSGIWTIFLWIICLSIPNFQFIIFDFGRNDITLAFWELVAFWGLLQAVKEANQRNWWLVYTGISLGMGMGVKPNGLYYLLGFIVLILTPLFPPADRSKVGLSKLIDVLLKIVLPAGIIGGFWYFRNLLKMGNLFNSELIKFGKKSVFFIIY